MKLSVLLITYNHEKYIIQALESILTQKVNFDFEIIIGDDFSQDKTASIVHRFYSTYQKKIVPVLRKKNSGMMNNFVDVLQKAKGKYIALCEGDDYWTDTLKLQKQVDFLEANEDFAISSHNVVVKNEETGATEEWLGREHKDVYTVSDLLKYGSGGATCSLIFKKDAVGKIPDWFYERYGGDWALQILCTKHGKMKYFTEPMGVYRRNEAGISNLKTGSEKDIIRFEDKLKLVKILDEEFSYKYSKELNYNLINYFYPHLIKSYEAGKQKSKKRKTILLLLFTSLKSGIKVKGLKNYIRKFLL